MKWTYAALACVLLFSAALRVASVLNVVDRSPDERVYASRARILLASGLAGARRVAEEYGRDPEQWTTPLPTRVGYTVLVAAAMKITGEADARAGACLSCFASILSLLAAAAIGLRFFGRQIAILALIFLAVFPPDLVLAGRCWQDSVVGLAGLLMFWLTLEIVAKPRGWIYYAGLATLGAALLLIKETLIFCYAPCLLAVLITRRERVALLLSSTVAATLVCGLALAAVTGGIAETFALVQHASQAVARQPYALQTSSGPGYLLLFGFERLCPLTTNLSPLGLLAAVRERRIVRLLALLASAFAVAFMVVPHWLNLRFLSPIYVPLCLFAGAGLWHLFQIACRRLPPRLIPVVAACGIAGIAIALLADFRRVERAGFRDLSVGMVFAATRD